MIKFPKREAVCQQCISQWAQISCICRCEGIYCTRTEPPQMGNPQLHDAVISDRKWLSLNHLRIASSPLQHSAVSSVTMSGEQVLEHHAYYHCAARWFLPISLSLCVCRYEMSNPQSPTHDRAAKPVRHRGSREGFARLWRWCWWVCRASKSASAAFNRSLIDTPDEPFGDYFLIVWRQSDCLLRLNHSPLTEAISFARKPASTLNRNITRLRIASRVSSMCESTNRCCFSFRGFACLVRGTPLILEKHNIQNILI